MPTLAGNVIRGTASYNAAAGTSPTAITLPRTINAAKSVVFYTQRGGESTLFRDHREYFGYELTNTTLQFLRTTATSAQTMNLSYEVVEFADATSVQHVVQEITSTQTDITISAVDMSRSVVFVLGIRTDQDDIRGGTVRLESSTNVRVNCNTAPGAGDLILYIAVVQFDTDVSVQRGVVSLGSGNTTASGTVNIEEIDPTRSVVIGGGQNDLNQYLKRMAVSWSIVDGETIAWNRAVYGSQTSKILPWQVITLANGFSRHGSYEITDGNTTPASQPSFSALDPTKSSLVVGFPLNECRPTVDITSTGMGGGANYRATIVPTVDFDGLTITRGNARSGTSMAGTFAAFQWEGGEPTEETPPKDVAIINIGPGPSSVSGDVFASPGGSAVGTSLRYCITESDTPPSEESEDWIDLDWDDLPYPVTFKGSRGLFLHAYTIGSLDPSSVVTHPFTSPNLRVVGPVSNQPVPLDGFETGIVDSTGHEPGAAGRIDWRADGNTQGEDVSIVVNAPIEEIPENLSAPIVTGTFRVGGVAYAGTGEWAGNPTSYTYQWVIDDEDVSGATNAFYEFQSGDLGLSGYCRVTAINDAGSSDPEVSATFGPILEAFDPGDLPEVYVDTVLLDDYTELDEFVSHTGTYKHYLLGYVSNGFAFLILDPNEQDYDIAIARYGGIGRTDDTHFVEQEYAVVVDGTPYTVRVAPGSIKPIGNPLPSAAPTMQHLIDAVETAKVAPYGMDAYDKFALPGVAIGNQLDVRSYDPSSIYWRDAQTGTNVFGNISGDGGEYKTSRSFMADIDCRLVIAALTEDSGLWSAVSAALFNQTLWSLSLPLFAIMSENHMAMRDPQIPFAGDKKWATGGTSNVPDNYSAAKRWLCPYDYPHINTVSGGVMDIVSITNANPCVVTYDMKSSFTGLAGERIVLTECEGLTELNGNIYYIRNVNTTAKTFQLSVTESGPRVDSTEMGTYTGGGIGQVFHRHSRNLEHLFNHCYAYFLASGDPRAALVQQAILANALAAVSTTQSGSNYLGIYNNQRSSLNMQNIMFKMEKVAELCDGGFMWSNERITKMITDCRNYYKAQRNALEASTVRRDIAYKTASFIDASTPSRYMLASYGTEVGYLLALNGDDYIQKLLARHAQFRFGDIGGTLAYFGRETSASNFNIASAINPLPYEDLEGLIDWVLENPEGISTTDFENARSATHILIRFRTILKNEQDLINRGLRPSDPTIAAAITKINDCADATVGAFYRGDIHWQTAQITYAEAGIEPDLPEEE